MRSQVDGDTAKELILGSRRDQIQRVVVGAVIRRNDRFLLLERNPSDFMGGLVELPSGVVDTGEDLWTALDREVAEETGLTIDSIVAYIGSFDYVSGSGKKTRQFNFLVDVVPGEVRVEPSEHRTHFFVGVSDEMFGALNISNATRRVLGSAAKRR